MSDYPENYTVLFSGIAKVPKNAPDFERRQEISCVMEIDMNTKKIIALEFGRLKPLTIDFIQRIVVGYDLSAGIELLENEIHARCQLVSKNAVIKSMHLCYERYIEYKMPAFSKPN